MNQNLIQQQQTSKTTDGNECNQIERDKTYAIPNTHISFNRLDAITAH